MPRKAAASPLYIQLRHGPDAFQAQRTGPVRDRLPAVRQGGVRAAVGAGEETGWVERQVGIDPSGRTGKGETPSRKRKRSASSSACGLADTIRGCAYQASA